MKRWFSRTFENRIFLNEPFCSTHTTCSFPHHKHTQRAFASLRGLTDADRGRVTVHYGEEWTPRKVARRALEHEREHLAQIRELGERYSREDLS